LIVVDVREGAKLFEYKTKLTVEFFYRLSNDEKYIILTTKGKKLQKIKVKNVKELDNRGSHFYLALFWAEELANCDDTEISASFKGLAAELEANKETILNELNEVQGQAVNIGGYYYPNADLAAKALRPSETFNHAVESLLTNA